MARTTDSYLAEGAQLYKQACAADDAYSQACSDVSGGKRNRWDLTAREERNPAVCAARQALHEASRRWLDWLRDANARAEK